MRTLQNLKESWESMPRTWFLQESWGIHTQSLLLYENSTNLPYSLSKDVKRYVLKWMNGLLYHFWSDWTRLASKCIRHGELMFLHQWVSATSALRSFGRLRLPREYIVRHGELWTFALWTSSPWARLSLAIASFLAFHLPLRVGGEWDMGLTGIARLGLAMASWTLYFFIVFLLCLVCWHSNPAQMDRVR